MSGLLWAALLSMTPIGELRAGIPVAIAYGVNPWLAYVVCVLANIAIIPIVMFFLEWMHKRFMHMARYRTAFDRYMDRTRGRTHNMVEKYGVFGLALFVAVPLPVTGAYTATVAAWFFGLNKWKAFWSISAGVIIAGAIVSGIAGGIKLLAIV